MLTMACRSFLARIFLRGPAHSIQATTGACVVTRDEVVCLMAQSDTPTHYAPMFTRSINTAFRAYNAQQTESTRLVSHEADLSQPLR